GPADDDELFILRSPRFGEMTLSIEMVKRIEYVPAVAPGVLPELESAADHDVTYFAAQDGRPAQADPASELVRIVKDGVFLYNSILDGDEVSGKKYAWSKLRGVVCYRGRHNHY